MPTQIAKLEVKWWPVGQGLFMSGRLSAKTGGHFNWVYDCGSSSGAKERNDAIKKYRSQLANKPIDLVVLSHFDEDHINGIVALVKGLHIKTLLLPYLPLWHRLLIAIGSGLTEDSELMPFYVNPASYLESLEEGQIDEIVFVPATEPDDVVPLAEDAPDFDRPIQGGEVDSRLPVTEDKADPALASEKKIRVCILARRGRITVSALWEFVPYNDASMWPSVSSTFINRVSVVARAFCAKPKWRKVALKILKRIYQKTFGVGSIPANVISLFLYSGPVGKQLQFGKRWSSTPLGYDHCRDNLAQLATGDGYLDTPARLTAMRSFFSPDRMRRVGLFQVMHHGAEPNWHVGLANIIKPAASIFSSDPNFTHGHPNAKVLRDFWPWTAICVDKNKLFKISVVIKIP